MNLEPGMDEAFVRDVWLRLGEEVKVKLISKGPEYVILMNAHYIYD